MPGLAFGTITSRKRRHGEAREDGVALQFAAFHDELGAGFTGFGAAHGAFFGGLENEFDGAFIFFPAYYFCGSEEHGGVDVVAAGVHDTFGVGGEGDAGFFFYGEGVHIGTEDDGGAFDLGIDGLRIGSFFQGADDAGEGETFGGYI